MSFVIYDIFVDDVRHGLELAALGMDVQLDGTGEVETENTHNGLCINYIAA